jgi:predicted dinucleotide-binding enzyme
MDAKRVAAGLVSDLRFDCLDVGPLSEGRRLGPGSRVFGGRFTLDELRTALREEGPA